MGRRHIRNPHIRGSASEALPSSTTGITGVLSLIFKIFESSIFDFWLEAFFLNFEFRFSNFSCGHLFLSRFDFDARNFLQKNLGRRDRFRPKIVEIGAILGIFEPFEILKIKKKSPHATFWRIWPIVPGFISKPLTKRPFPGTFV